MATPLAGQSTSNRWTKVQKRRSQASSSGARKHSKPTPSTSYVHKNKYISISLDEDTSSSEESDIADTPAPQRTVRIPPVVVDQPTSDVTATLRRYKMLAKSNINFVNRGRQLHIICESETDFHTLITSLHENNIPYHTFTAKHQKPLRYVVRGLSQHTTPDEVQIGLHEHQASPLKVSQLTYSDENGRAPTHLFLVEFPPGTDPKQIRNIKHIHHTIVTWEPYRRPKGPTQCRRCLAFGHGQMNCNRSPRCVKCAGNHLMSDCPLPKGKSDSVNCANCNGNHPASYKGCPAYKEYTQKQAAARASNMRRGRRPPAAKPPANNDVEYPPLGGSNAAPLQPATWPSQPTPSRTPRRQQQQAAQQTAPTPPQSSSTVSPHTIFSDIKQMLTEAFNFIKSFLNSPFLSQVKSLIHALSNTTDSADKLICISEFFLSLCS
jgi:hypothetical protein